MAPGDLRRIRVCRSPPQLRRHRQPSLRSAVSEAEVTKFSIIACLRGDSAMAVRWRDGSAEQNAPRHSPRPPGFQNGWPRQGSTRWSAVSASVESMAAIPALSSRPRARFRRSQSGIEVSGRRADDAGYVLRRFDDIDGWSGRRSPTRKRDCTAKAEDAERHASIQAVPRPEPISVPTEAEADGPPPGRPAQIASAAWPRSTRTADRLPRGQQDRARGDDRMTSMMFEGGDEQSARA